MIEPIKGGAMIKPIEGGILVNILNGKGTTKQIYHGDKMVQISEIGDTFTKTYVNTKEGNIITKIVEKLGGGKCPTGQS